MIAVGKSLSEDLALLLCQNNRFPEADFILSDLGNVQ